MPALAIVSPQEGARPPGQLVRGPPHCRWPRPPVARTQNAILTRFMRTLAASRANLHGSLSRAARAPAAHDLGEDGTPVGRAALGQGISHTNFSEVVELRGLVTDELLGRCFRRGTPALNWRRISLLLDGLFANDLERVRCRVPNCLSRPWRRSRPLHPCMRRRAQVLSGCFFFRGLAVMVQLLDDRGGGKIGLQPRHRRAKVHAPESTAPSSSSTLAAPISVNSPRMLARWPGLFIHESITWSTVFWPLAMFSPTRT